MGVVLFESGYSKDTVFVKMKYGDFCPEAGVNIELNRS